MSNHVLLKPAPRLAAAPSESTDYRIQAPNVELDEVGARLLQPPPLPAASCVLHLATDHRNPNMSTSLIGQPA
jgi:hypothetical protein